MSSDFMMTLVSDDEDWVDIPRTIKPVSKLTKRTIELFEIERRYYLEMGQVWEWKVVFDTKKPVYLIRNIDWLYDAKRLDNRPGIDFELVKMVEGPLLNQLIGNGYKDSLSKNCLLIDKKLGLESGSSMFITQYLLANKVWTTDMNQLIRENKPLIVAKNKELREGDRS